MFPIPISQECVRIRGWAHGTNASDWEGPPSQVNGIYTISSIDAPNHAGGFRRETVGFKVSGIGPDQIAEPKMLKSLTISEQ